MFKLFLLLGLVACGDGKTTEYVPSPGNPPAQPPNNGGGGNGGNGGGNSGGAASYQEVSGILTTSCGNSGCHSGAGFLQSEQNLRGSTQVKNRIANGSMPPRYAGNYNLWADGSRKNKVLKFLGN